MRNIVILFSFMCVASGSFGATAAYETKIRRVVVHDTNFGGCMAFVGRPPSDLGLDCNGNWVVLDCLGEEGSKTAGQAKFAAAQLSLVTNTKVYIQVTDDVHFNANYCYGNRIDNIQEGALKVDFYKYPLKFN